MLRGGAELEAIALELLRRSGEEAPSNADRDENDVNADEIRTFLVRSHQLPPASNRDSSTTEDAGLQDVHGVTVVTRRRSEDAAKRAIKATAAENAT